MDTTFNRLLARYSSVNSPVPDTQRFKTLQKSVDLSQAAGSYTLYTCNGTGGVVLLGADIYCTVSGATFTSVSIQTNATTPFVILSAGEGALGNIVAGKNLVKAYQQGGYLATSGLIQYTMAGSAGSGTLLMTLRYVPSVAGADLS